MHTSVTLTIVYHQEPPPNNDYFPRKKNANNNTRAHVIALSNGALETALLVSETSALLVSSTDAAALVLSALAAVSELLLASVGETGASPDSDVEAMGDSGPVLSSAAAVRAVGYIYASTVHTRELLFGLKGTRCSAVIVKWAQYDEY